MGWRQPTVASLVDPKRLPGFFFLFSILIFIYFLKYETIVLYVLQFFWLIFFCLATVPTFERKVLKFGIEERKNLSLTP